MKQPKIQIKSGSDSARPRPRADLRSHQGICRHQRRLSLVIKLTLVVACALIDADNRILLAQRPEGKALAGLWEFPAASWSPGSDRSPR
jgi:hypothetical protein